MKTIIEALNIFLKYEDVGYPFGCEHDVLYVYYDPAKISEKDIDILDDIGFHADFDNEHFYYFV